MRSDNVTGLDTERLQILLKIVREQKFSFDDLDDWTRHLDWQEFQDWSEIFLKAKTNKGGSFRLRLLSGTAHLYREVANDNLALTDFMDGSLR